MQQRGVDLNKVEKEFIQMAYSNMRQQAERDVRGAMLLDEIAELEKVEVSRCRGRRRDRQNGRLLPGVGREIRESH